MDDSDIISISDDDGAASPAPAPAPVLHTPADACRVRRDVGGVPGLHLALDVFASRARASARAKRRASNVAPCAQST